MILNRNDFGKDIIYMIATRTFLRAFKTFAGVRPHMLAFYSDKKSYAKNLQQQLERESDNVVFRQEDQEKPLAGKDIKTGWVKNARVRTGFKEGEEKEHDSFMKRFKNVKDDKKDDKMETPEERKSVLKRIVPTTTATKTADGSAPKKRRSRSEFLGENLVTTYKYEVREVKLKDELSNVRTLKESENKAFPYQAVAPVQPQPKPMDSVYVNSQTLKPIFSTLFKQLTQSLISQTPSQELSLHIEPTFELNLRRQIRSMKANGYKLSLKPAQPNDTFSILYVNHLRGLVTIRNHNYTTVEYDVRRNNENVGVVEYLPHPGENQRYPEMAYQRINDMVLQVGCMVPLPFELTVTSPKGETKTLPATHFVQFQNQLKHPPIFADMKLPFEKLLTKYRLNNNKWLITDINKQNNCSVFEYSDVEKKKLVSRVVV